MKALELGKIHHPTNPALGLEQSVHFPLTESQEESKCDFSFSPIPTTLYFKGIWDRSGE